MTLVERRVVENANGTNYGRPYRTWRDNVAEVVTSGEVVGLRTDQGGPGRLR